MADEDKSKDIEYVLILKCDKRIKFATSILQSQKIHSGDNVSFFRFHHNNSHVPQSGSAYYHSRNVG